MSHASQLSARRQKSAGARYVQNGVAAPLLSSRHLPTTTAMQCFEAAARHRSFTRAAEELSLTQSAVSKQVGQLEAHLQHKLFRRVRRSLVLTPEGAIYLSDVRKVLTQIAMSTQAIMTYSGNSEVLKVATLPSFGASWLAHRLPSFMQAHPDISLEFTNRVEDFSLVEQGIDVAFFYGHGSWPELECHKLMDEEVVAVAAPSLLAQHPVGCAGDIAELPLLHLSTRPDAWHLWFAAQGLQTDRSYHGSRFETFAMLLHTAMAGGGVAVVPRFIAQQALDRGQVVLAWPYALKSASAYYLVHPEQLGELSKVRHFVQHILRS